MCYSALVEADIRKLEAEFGGYFDIESFFNAYVHRMNYKFANIPAAIDTYFIQNAKTADEKKMALMAREFYQREIDKMLAKKVKYENDIIEAEKKVKAKPDKSKGAREILEKRPKRIAELDKQLEHYKNIEEFGAARTFPLSFAPAIVQDGSKRKIQLLRYQVLAKSGKELTPFKYNLFNARRDSLFKRTWAPLFGKKHAIFPFYRFYESVEGEDCSARIIYFQPENEELMWSAALFEECQTGFDRPLRSMAAVTDEPPPEVAETGHDRCPVFLSDSKGALDAWLHPKGKSLEELDQLLDQKVETIYDHFDAVAYEAESA